jgi:indole-3-glycerol phosphate synthase
MKDFLSEIIELKQKRLDEAKAEISFEELREDALFKREAAPRRALREALTDDSRLNVIAEFKRASPSKGWIDAEASSTKFALLYEEGGAAAISVLTEEDKFQGYLNDLRNVRAAVDLPVLRKDFLFDEFQIYEAASAGADALLLIVAMLDDETLLLLRKITEDELMMDALVEVHNEEELRRAINCGAKIIGVNNRDLRSFNVSLDVSIDLIKHAPKDVSMVAESGLSKREDLIMLREHGYNGFLIGESLMKTDDVKNGLRSLVLGL